MPKPESRAIADVKPVTFQRFDISTDGETIVFELRQTGGGVGHIGIKWLDLSLAVQLIGQAAEKSSEVRRSLGKSDNFDGRGELTAQLVSTFQVSEYSDQKLKVLSLHSPIGFRCDFAIPTDAVDQRGRPYPRAIAEELLSDTTHGLQRPH
jgi:hypothetical protein